MRRDIKDRERRYFLPSLSNLCLAYLRDKIYNCMVERSKNSNIEYIEYRSKKTSKD